MKYNQPYLNPDTDAPFYNGNSETGTMGSIPPAASIEHPQREIVKVIQWASDHGYVDMNGVLCEAPNFNKLDQLLKAMFGVMNSRLLRAPRNYYVNGTSGSNSNDGLTTGTAFATIQKALDVTTTWNQNGFGVSINVAPGSYQGVTLPQLNGTGGCRLVGSGTSNCTISGVNQSAVLLYNSTGGYDISNFALASSGVPPVGDNGCGIQVQGPSNVTIHDVKFLNCISAHMLTLSGASLNPVGPIEIAGSATNHVMAGWSAFYIHAQPPPTLIISAPGAFTTFMRASDGALCVCNYASITGAANATGAKYNSSSNSIIQTTGGGVNYLPGTTPGTVSTGGQYL